MTRFVQSHRRAKGLTLLELLVVLVVLAALAGIMVPLFPSVLVRAHGATGAANINEIVKAIQVFEATNLVYPNGWDSLLTDDTGLESIFEHDDAMDVGDLSAAEVASLAAAGITQVFDHAGEAEGMNTFSRTSVYGSATPSPRTLIADEDQVMRLTASGINDLNLTPGGNYVAFGLGMMCSAVGKTLADAPVHFPDPGEDSPAEYYSRFIVIFEIPAEGPARLATVASVHHEGEELSGLTAHLGELYESF